MRRHVVFPGTGTPERKSNKRLHQDEHQRIVSKHFMGFRYSVLFYFHVFKKEDEEEEEERNKTKQHNIK